MIKRLPLDLIHLVSVREGVDFSLLAAIVWQESGGNAEACRFEPGFKYLLDVEKYARSLNQSKLTEEVQQKTSWGLCQIMGAVLRELGFNEYLPQSLDPETNLIFACRQIKRIVSTKKVTKFEDILACYNAGSVIKTTDGKYKNQGYVDSAIKYMERIRKLDTL